MKAAIYDRYGPPEVLRIAEIDAPSVRPEEEGRLLVRVHAASMNPYDIWFRSGYLPARLSGGFARPKQRILGIDVAGTVEAISGNVSRFQPGDRVFGNVVGAHAEFVRARETHLARIPDGVSFHDAAAVPTCALTALQALRDVANLQPGQKILVFGASGGIGHMAVQLACHEGAEVTAVTSTRNLEWVSTLGAHHVIDYTMEDFAKNGEGYDVILDSVAKRSFFNSRRSLTPTGLYITENPLMPKSHPFQLLFARLTGDRRAKFHLAEARAGDFDAIADLMRAGRLRPVIEEVLPLEQIVEAHRHVEGGHTKGKVVVEVRN